MGAYQDTDHYGGVDWIKEKHNAMGVIDDIIEKLTSDSPDERMSAALEISTKTEELSLTGDYAIEKLMCVVNGGARTFKIEKRKFLGLIPYNVRTEEHYGLEHQLAAIEALGNIGGKKAEEYLAQLLKYETSTIEMGDTSHLDSSARAQLDYSEIGPFYSVISHPRARGDLAMTLIFESKAAHDSAEGAGDEAFETMKESRVRKKLEEAYEKLKQNISDGS